MRFSKLTGAIVCAALAAACGTTEPNRPTLEEDLRAIAAFNERYVGAINDGDIATLSGLTTEGHIMLMPGRAPLVGKAANDAANARVFEHTDIHETWTPVETKIDGDLAYQRGTYVVIARPKNGGEAREVRGHFLRIYERQANGEWRMTRDMFNTDSAAPSEPPAPP
jgi:ketosteroid isomerase-like protein